jgi:hypothetical protein
MVALIVQLQQLTEEQRIRVEAELIKHLGFDRIVWMDLPAGLTEDGAKAIAVKTTKILDLYHIIYSKNVRTRRNI